LAPPLLLLLLLLLLLFVLALFRSMFSLPIHLLRED
jgi:hypothetical protein